MCNVCAYVCGCCLSVSLPVIEGRCRCPLEPRGPRFFFSLSLTFSFSLLLSTRWVLSRFFPSPPSLPPLLSVASLPLTALTDLILFPPPKLKKMYSLLPSHLGSYLFFLPSLPLDNTSWIKPANRWKKGTLSTQTGTLCTCTSHPPILQAQHSSEEHFTS
ncbi:hypothetical protein BKA57DRAFT_282799 [Linnemannia elongata]|nr:hypothetical protein BKA57DRAFT_282799 [Linnemannia elongata]